MTESEFQTLKFPVFWHSRLIVGAEAVQVDENLIASIFASLGLAPDEILRTGASCSGKYVSWGISCNIPDNMTFRALLHALQDIPGFVMLL